MKLRHPALLRLLPPLAAKVLSGVYRTCRELSVGRDYESPFLARQQPVLYTFWHGQLAYPLYYFRGRRGVIMTSPSFDGELIGKIGAQFGFPAFHGSQGKGGGRVIAAMAGLVKRGFHAGVVADGSRGPRHVVQKGIVVLARRTQAPIIPLAVASRRKMVFNTWDRFELTLPFSAVALLFGPPLFIPPDTPRPRLESFRRELEDRLLLLYRQSQHFFPCPPPHPDLRPPEPRWD